MRMLKASAGFRGDGSFKGWMFNIAHNQIFDHLRREKRLQPMDQKEQEKQTAKEPGPEQAASDREGSMLLQRALGLLPAAAREVIWLGRFHFDGYDELGRALECSAGTARVRMHRAIKQLREVFLGLSEDSDYA